MEFGYLQNGNKYGPSFFGSKKRIASVIRSFKSSLKKCSIMYLIW